MRALIHMVLNRILAIVGVATLFVIVPTNIALSADDILWRAWRETGLQAWQEGRLRIAEHLLVAAMEQAETFGPEDWRVAETANDLGILYATDGKIPQAEQFFHRSLDLRKKQLGPEDPSVGVTMQNLGLLYAVDHKYMAAESLLKSALEINLKHFGFTHTRTAQTLHSLSSLYAIQGQMPQAERLIKASLAILEGAQVKQEDPQMTSTLQVFAVILRNTNREHEAQEIEQRLAPRPTSIQ